MKGRVAASGRDLRVLAGIVRDDRGEPPAEGLAPSLLDDLLGLIRCDLLNFAGTDSIREVDWFGQTRPIEAHDPEFDVASFWRHYWSSPCSYPERTGDVRSLVRISDFYSARQWHSTGMYQDCSRRYGIEHELMVCLPAGPGRSVRLIFFRGAGADFTERDRGLLALLRQHLHEAYRVAERRRRGDTLELTPRQRELLHLVADGYTNAQIGRRLGLSEATVRKHLENIFARLRVTNRTAAVIKAFPDQVA